MEEAKKLQEGLKAERETRKVFEARLDKKLEERKQLERMLKAEIKKRDLLYKQSKRIKEMLSENQEKLSFSLSQSPARRNPYSNC